VAALAMDMEVARVGVDNRSEPSEASDATISAGQSLWDDRA
jgi:hypothetical protein